MLREGNVYRMRMYNLLKALLSFALLIIIWPCNRECRELPPPFTRVSSFRLWATRVKQRHCCQHLREIKHICLPSADAWFCSSPQTPRILYSAGDRSWSLFLLYYIIQFRKRSYQPLLLDRLHHSPISEALSIEITTIAREASYMRYDPVRREIIPSASPRMVVIEFD